VIVKMGKARYSFITIIPLIWLSIVALTGGWQKIFSDDIKIGFLSHAAWVGEKLAQGIVPPGVASAGDAARRRRSATIATTSK